MEEFEKMSKRTRLFYIASEVCESENPCRTDVEIFLAMLKRGARF